MQKKNESFFGCLQGALSLVFYPKNRTAAWFGQKNIFDVKSGFGRGPRGPAYPQKDPKDIEKFGKMPSYSI